MENLHEYIAQLVQTNPWLAPFAVFLGGVLTASNPCVLAMIPLMIGYVSGSKEIHNWKSGLIHSFFFIIGLSITFTFLGVFAALAGRLLGDVGSAWKYIIAAVAFIMGLHLLGLFQFSLPFSMSWKPKKAGWISALLLGVLFGIISTPCAVPILVLLLTYIAMKGSSAVFGGFLLLIYAFGHGILILAAGTSIGLAKGMLESKRFNTATNVLRKIGGILIIGVGIYFVLS